MIRWEQQENGDWRGFSGELPVATVAKDPDAEREQWAWKIACSALFGQTAAATHGGHRQRGLRVLDV